MPYDRLYMFCTLWLRSHCLSQCPKLPNASYKVHPECLLPIESNLSPDVFGVPSIFQVQYCSRFCHTSHTLGTLLPWIAIFLLCPRVLGHWDWLKVIYNTFYSQIVCYITLVTVGLCNLTHWIGTYQGVPYLSIQACCDHASESVSLTRSVLRCGILVLLWG